MASFFVTTILFAVFVNGKVGGLLASLYVVLRRAYANRYRASVGKAMMDKGLGQFTIPCYFILNAMALAVVVQVARAAFEVVEEPADPVEPDAKGGIFKWLSKK